jgi:WD40 repeat protein
LGSNLEMKSTETVAVRPVKLFISYRKDDTGATASRLYKDLESAYGRDSVFLDDESIPGGTQWVRQLASEASSASVMLVLIGDKWLDEDPTTHQRKLDREKDYVRQEIEAALSAGSLIIPMLVDGTPALAPSSLDDIPSLAPFPALQAMELRRKDWESDMIRLKTRLENHGFRSASRRRPKEIPAVGEAILLHPREMIFENIPQQPTILVGRESELKWIHQSLIGDPTRYVMIWGLSGVGKTALAAEYANRYKNHYSGVWYASAKDRSVLIGSLAQLAGRLDSRLSKEIDRERAAKEGIASFPSFDPPFLLIYDAVPLFHKSIGQKLGDNLRNLIPAAGARILLIAGWTPHSSFTLGQPYIPEEDESKPHSVWGFVKKAWPWSTPSRCEILPLVPKDATDLVQKCAQRTDTSGAARLARALSCLPSELVQAANRCRDARMSFDTYREKYVMYSTREDVKERSVVHVDDDLEYYRAKSLQIDELMAQDVRRSVQRSGALSKTGGGLRPARVLDVGDINCYSMVSFTPGGTQVIAYLVKDDSYSPDWVAKRWHAETGELLSHLEGYHGLEKECQLSPCGNWIVLGDIIYWRHWRDFPIDHLRTSLVEKSESISACAFSGDGKWLALGIQSDRSQRTNDTERSPYGHTEIRIHPWDDGEGKFSGEFPGPFRFVAESLWRFRRPATVSSIAFSPDGKWLACSGVADGLITIWDFQNSSPSGDPASQTQATSRGQMAPAVADRRLVLSPESGSSRLEFSSDGNFLASSSSTELKLWHIASSEEPEWGIDLNGNRLVKKKDFRPLVAVTKLLAIDQDKRPANLSTLLYKSIGIPVRKNSLSLGWRYRCVPFAFSPEEHASPQQVAGKLGASERSPTKNLSIVKQ